jgi:hypothetical protein
LASLPPAIRRVLTLGAAAPLLLLALLACGKGGDIQPGVGAAGVLLGANREAVEKVLGKPQSVNTSGVHASQDSESTYLLYPALGIDVLLDGGKVRSIFLYNEGVEDHKKYSGRGSGISLSSKRDQVLEALGEPSARALGLDRDLWFRYDSGLELVFDRDGNINHIVVSAPHK